MPMKEIKEEPNTYHVLGLKDNLVMMPILPKEITFKIPPSLLQNLYW